MVMSILRSFEMPVLCTENDYIPRYLGISNMSALKYKSSGAGGCKLYGIKYLGKCEIWGSSDGNILNQGLTV